MSLCCKYYRRSNETPGVNKQRDLNPLLQTWHWIKERDLLNSLSTSEKKLVEYQNSMNMEFFSAATLVQNKKMEIK